MSATVAENPQQTQAVATTAPQKSPVLMGARGLEITDLDGLWRLSNYISKSGLAPKGIETPEAIFTAIELGLELGMPPMAALQNIAVINGRPGVYGDMPLALVRASGLLEDYSEEEVGKPYEDSYGFRCVCKRSGRKFRNSTFTVGDAKKAQLWGKQGPWSQYPKRMLMFRARGFLLRDEFGDVLKGVKTVEELRELDDQERFDRAKSITPPPPPVTPIAERSQQAATETTTAPSGDDGDLGPETKQQPAETKAANGGTEQPKRETKAPEGEMTVQQELAHYFTVAGVPWDVLSAFGREMGWPANWDNIDGFETMPNELAKAVYAGRKFTLQQIDAFRKEKKP